jgi:twitching motility protein PilT
VRREAATADTVDVNGLLGMLVKARGSDLHLAVGAPPFMRVHGDITPMPGQATLMDEALDRALIGLLSENQVHKFRTESELDFAYTVRVSGGSAGTCSSRGITPVRCSG